MEEKGRGQKKKERERRWNYLLNWKKIKFSNVLSHSPPRMNKTYSTIVKKKMSLFTEKNGILSKNVLIYFFFLFFSENPFLENAISVLTISDSRFNV